MKKILAAVAVAAVLVAGAVAEITFGTWMRVQAAVVASDGNDLYAGMENSWGGGARTGRLDIHGVDDEGKVGMESQIFLSVDSYEVGYDQIYFWAQPIKYVKFSLGDFDGGAGVRGDFCYGSWNWIRPYTWLVDDEGLTFDSIDFAGTLLEIFPIDGLQIYWALPLTDHISQGNTDMNGDALNSSFNDGAQAAFCSSAAGVTYTMPDVFKVKVGYFGDYNDNTAGLEDGTSTGKLSVGFDLMAVENLYVTAGFRFRVADADYMAYNKQEQMKIALGASYALGNLIGWDPGFTVYVAGTVFLYDWEDDGVEIDHDPRFSFGVGVDFGILENLKIEADVRYISETKYEDTNGEDDSVSFLIGVVYSLCSNGELGIGFQGATNGNGMGQTADGARDLQYEDKFAWAIPVRLGIWF